MNLAPGFFVQEAGRYAPTGRGVSPWNGHSLGGVAIAGLAAHLIDRAPTHVPMHPARLTIDIFGAVPMEPLTPAVHVIRDGRRIQAVDITLESAGRIWARASALRVRTVETPPSHSSLTPVFPAPPYDRQTTDMSESFRIDHSTTPTGKGRRWVRFPFPVVVGEPLGALEAIAMAADFGSGISPLFPYRDWTFANLDISVSLSRLPRGEWIFIDAQMQSSGNGIGIAHSELGDAEGMIGTSQQSVFLDRR